MWKVSGAALAVVLSSGIACSSGSRDPIGVAGASGGPSVAPVGSAGANTSSCPVQAGCLCAGGLLGRYECIEGAERCDCTGCEGAPPMERPDPTFEACGGELFGMWRLTDVDVKATKVTLVSSRTKQKLTCPVDAKLVDTPDAAAHALLRFDSGGKGIGKIGGPLLSLEIKPDCSAQIGETCGDFGCGPGACGLCNCSSRTFSWPAAAMSWTRTDSIVALEFEGSTALLVFDFCVDGNTLALHHVPDRVELHLERVYPRGRPLPCDQRTAETCKNSAQESEDGCELGRCVGPTPDCAQGTSQATCTNRQGCKWDATSCSGVQAEECGAADYDVVPGCVLSQAPAVCGGGLSACSNFAANACPSRLGCLVEPRCSGVGEECKDYYASPGECPPGCTCEDVAGECYCTGQSDCTWPDRARCEAPFSGCQWSSYCSGEIDCALLTPRECGSFEGCELISP